MRQPSALSFSFSLSPALIWLPLQSQRGSGAAMSPFPHNPSPRLAADRPGAGPRPPGASSEREVPASIATIFQGPARGKRQEREGREEQDSPSSASGVNESGLTSLLLQIRHRLVNLTALC